METHKIEKHYNAVTNSYQEYSIDSQFRLNGVSKEWNTSGRLTQRAEYKDNKLNGIFRAWNGNGILVRYAVYKDGKCVMATDRDGKNRIRAVSHYKNGHLHGAFVKYNTEGVKTVRCDYDNGQLDGVCVKRYDDGGIKEVTMYKQGLKNGYSVMWNKSGVMTSKCHYVNDMQQGLQEYYDNKGMCVEIRYVKTFGDTDKSIKTAAESLRKKHKAIFK